MSIWMMTFPTYRWKVKNWHQLVGIPTLVFINGNPYTFAIYGGLNHQPLCRDSHRPETLRLELSICPVCVAADSDWTEDVADVAVENSPSWACTRLTSFTSHLKNLTIWKLCIPGIVIYHQEDSQGGFWCSVPWWTFRIEVPEPKPLVFNRRGMQKSDASRFMMSSRKKTNVVTLQSWHWILLGWKQYFKYFKCLHGGPNHRLTSPITDLILPSDFQLLYSCSIKSNPDYIPMLSATGFIFPICQIDFLKPLNHAPIDDQIQHLHNIWIYSLNFGVPHTYPHRIPLISLNTMKSHSHFGLHSEYHEYYGYTAWFASKCRAVST